MQNNSQEVADGAGFGKGHVTDGAELYKSRMPQKAAMGGGSGCLCRQSKQEINDYILDLIKTRNISSSQQNQRINAIKFYYEKV